MVTGGLLPDIAGNIATVDITETGFLPQLNRLVNRRDGRRPDILHFVTGMKPAQVPGRFRSQGTDELSQLF